MPDSRQQKNSIQRACSSHLAIFAALASLALAPAWAAAEELEWTIYAGRWDLEKEGETSEMGFEVQRPLGSKGFDWVGGLAATADQAVWVYAGVSFSWEPSGKWRLRPGFAASAFENGDGKDLGGVIEFRSSLEVTYRAGQNLRLGLLFYHLSSAGIYDPNPGSNSLVFVVGFP